MIKILTACLSAASTEGEYQYSESSSAEYGETWDGDALGYVENLDLEASITINGEYDGTIRNLPANAIVLVENRRPIEIYWTSQGAGQ